LPVEFLTRRDYSGPTIKVAMKGGRSVTVTADHPFYVAAHDCTDVRLELAAHLTEAHQVPALRDLDSPNGFPRHRVDNCSVIETQPRVGLLWVPVVGAARRHFIGSVYSMEVPDTHTFVTGVGVVCHNCFPKDVSALKQLAGNSGYHFQLLTAVIEVNELQKRRVIAKLHKHLGELPGRRVALFGLAFKPHTDDMREASSLVLAARLNADGARVTAYDPVAEEQARELVSGISFAPSALEAAAGADAVVLVTE